MSASWRDKAKKKFKKPAESFFDFADEETTFNQAEIPPVHSEATSETAINASTPPAPGMATAVEKKPLSRGARPDYYLRDLESSKAYERGSNESNIASAAPELINQPSVEVEPKLSQLTQPNESVGNPSEISKKSAVSPAPSLSNLLNNQIDSSDKVEPKLSQSEAKVRPKRSKSADKVEPKLSPKGRSDIKSWAKVEPQPEPAHEPKLNQTQAKVEPHLSLDAVIGLQKNCLFFIYENCRFNGDKISSAITVQNFAESVETSVAAARKAIQRLEAKGFISRPEYKDGRGGWTKYRITDSVYSALLHNETRAKVEQKLSQNRAKVEPQLEPQPEPNTPSKLVSDLNNNLLTSESTSPVDNLSELELGLVSKFGISKKHIQDIRNQKLNLSTLDLQDLITRFGIYASDANNIRGVRNLPALFMKMAQQLAQGENMLEGIETPEDQALAKILKDREAQKARKQETEDALLTFEFETWLESVPTEKRNELVPESAVVRSGSHAQNVMLKKYYVENLWNDRRREMLNQATHRDLTF